MPTKVCNKNVPNCVTIDHTQNDEALQNARKAFPQTCSKFPQNCQHRTTKEAVTNLLACLNGTPGTKSVMIVGHGRSGIIITGTGKFDPDPAARITWDVRPALGGLGGGRIKELIFCSCDTGLPPYGTILLHATANIVGARVWGFTGFIFIDAQGNITCEPGNEWKYADPGTDALMLEVTIPVVFLGKAIMDIKLNDEGTYRVVQSSEVRSVSYYEPGLAEGSEPTFTLQREDAERVLRLINFSETFETAGAPLAIVTGELELKAGEDEKMEERRFVIYNDRLLQDKTSPTTFYRASPALADFLLTYR